MHLYFDNVQSAFHTLVRDVHEGKIPTTKTTSRYGDIQKICEPVMITYRNPCQRVLINPARDANSFFHVYESLWMLAGRRDVASLAYYNAKMRDFSDDGKEFNAAYGFRWKHNFGYDKWMDTAIGKMSQWTEIDQLKTIIDQLKRKPDSRRCWLEIWDVQQDLINIDDSKDLACNVGASFRINPATGALDISVHNRSNDMIWGCLGANVVQFSILLEYMAAHIGVPVGKYHQITDDLHIYQATWFPDRWLEAEGNELNVPRQHVPLVKDPAIFDQEVVKFVDLSPHERTITNWKEPFLQHVATPMCHVFNLHKDRHYDMAIKGIELIKAEDWSLAATQWVEKRKKAWEAKQGSAE